MLQQALEMLKSKKQGGGQGPVMPAAPQGGMPQEGGGQAPNPEMIAAKLMGQSGPGFEGASEGMKAMLAQMEGGEESGNQGGGEAELVLNFKGQAISDPREMMEIIKNYMG